MDTHNFVLWTFKVVIEKIEQEEEQLYKKKKSEILVAIGAVHMISVSIVRLYKWVSFIDQLCYIVVDHQWLHWKPYGRVGFKSAHA